MATVKNRLLTFGQFPARTATVIRVSLGLILLTEKEKKQWPEN